MLENSSLEKLHFFDNAHKYVVKGGILRGRQVGFEEI